MNNGINVSCKVQMRNEINKIIIQYGGIKVQDNIDGRATGYGTSNGNTSEGVQKKGVILLRRKEG